MKEDSENDSAESSVIIKATGKNDSISKAMKSIKNKHEYDSNSQGSIIDNKLIRNHKQTFISSHDEISQQSKADNNS